VNRARSPLRGALRCAAACVLATAALVAQRTEADATGLWHATNPGGGGWFERVAAGPTGVVIACSDLSGPYRSRDRGASWEALGPARGVHSTHASCVAFHPTDATVLYVGTDDGILASGDLGDHFTPSLGGGYIEHIAVAPSDAAVAYAGRHSKWNAADGQLYRTADRGQTWQRALAVGLPPGRRILEVAVAAADADEVYFLTGEARFAAGPTELYRSDDGGASVVAIHAAWGDRLVDFALDPHTRGVVYASVDDPDADAAGWLYRSADRGATWSQCSQRGGYIWLDRRVAGTVRMVDARHAYPWDARQGFWESTAAGAAGSWRRVGSVADWNAAWSGAHWSLKATSLYGGLGEDDSDPGTLYWVNKQFAFGTFDRGRTAAPLFADPTAGAPGATAPAAAGGWTSRGIDNVVIIDLAINEARPEEVYAAFHDLGTWRSLDGGGSWTPINDPAATGRWAGAGGNTWTVLTDPARPGVVWAPQGESPRSPSTLLFSTDAGTTWTVRGQGLPAEPILGLSLDRHSAPGERTLYCTAGGDVYGSVDDGATWTRRLADGGLRTTAVDRSEPGTVYAGGESGLWRSTRGGAPDTWREVGPAAMRGATRQLPGRRWVGVYDITPDPSVQGRLYATVHGPRGALYRSDDRGSTWEPALLRHPYLWCVVVDPADPATVFATSSSAYRDGGYRAGTRGVLRSKDAGDTWEECNQGLVWPFALALVLGPERAFVGSPGGGIHRCAMDALRTGRF